MARRLSNGSPTPDDMGAANTEPELDDTQTEHVQQVEAAAHDIDWDITEINDEDGKEHQEKPHADMDDKPAKPEDPGKIAWEKVRDSGDPEGAEPERVYNDKAAIEDTDNTHEDGNNGSHPEEYLDANEVEVVARDEANEFDESTDKDAGSLHPRDIGSRINRRSTSMAHSTLAPANRDETVVGDPSREKGLRPVGPLDGVNRSDDAGRPFDGGYLHTVDKGMPVGMGVTEHVPAPTASGNVPEGIMSARAPVPLTGHTFDPKRLDERQDKAGNFTLTEQHHIMLDHAEDLKRKNAESFTLANVGGTVSTAQELVKAGFLTVEDTLGGENFPQSGKKYTLT